MSVTASFLNFAGAAGLPPTATPGGKATWCPLPQPLAEDRGEDRGNNGDFFSLIPFRDRCARRLQLASISCPAARLSIAIVLFICSSPSPVQHLWQHDV